MLYIGRNFTRSIHAILLSMLLLTGISPAFSSSNPYPAIWAAHPFYLGAAAAYGSTDWSMMTAKCTPDDWQCTMIGMSVPIAADDNGFVGGVFIGYEIKDFFAVEANYAHFPKATISFDPNNFYPDLLPDGVTEIGSNTDVFYILGKFMTQLSTTPFRAFASAGIDFTYRYDVLADTIRIAPTFGVGINYLATEHFMLEFAFQYIAGYDKSSVTPAVDYIPFLYSLGLKVAYRY